MTDSTIAAIGPQSDTNHHDVIRSREGARRVGYRTSVADASEAARVQFAEPPVIAVVLTVLFEPVPGMQASHFSAVREMWREEYPNVTELPPLRPRNRGGEESKVMPITSAWPMPYLMFTSDDEGRSIAFQNDRFVRSWSFSEAGSTYPGFDEISRDLETHFQQFADTVRAETGLEIKVTGSVCDYTNDLPDLPPELLFLGITTRWPDDLPTEVPETLRSEYAGIRLHLCHDALQGCTVNLSLDIDEDGSFLGLVSMFDLPEAGDERADLHMGGLQHAHDRLIETFLEFTSPSMHAQWERQ